MKTLLAILLGFGLFLLISDTCRAESVPLPEDIQITPPGQDIPTEIASFFGKSGKWKGYCDIPAAGPYSSARVEWVLIVEQIDKKEAKIVYASAGYPQYNMPAEWQRVKADFFAKRGKYFMSFPLPSSSDRMAEGKFWIKDKGLQGERSARTGFGISTSTFTLKPFD
jgi:hypothetical protein